MGKYVVNELSLANWDALKKAYKKDTKKSLPTTGLTPALKKWDKAVAAFVKAPTARTGPVLEDEAKKVSAAADKGAKALVKAWGKKSTTENTAILEVLDELTNPENVTGPIFAKVTDSSAYREGVRAAIELAEGEVEAHETAHEKLVALDSRLDYYIAGTSDDQEKQDGVKELWGEIQEIMGYTKELFKQRGSQKGTPDFVNAEDRKSLLEGRTAAFEASKRVGTEYRRLAKELIKLHSGAAKELSIAKSLEGHEAKERARSA